MISGVVVVVVEDGSDDDGGGGESHRRGWNITPPKVKECCFGVCNLSCKILEEEEGGEEGEGKIRETKGSKLRNGK